MNKQIKVNIWAIIMKFHKLLKKANKSVPKYNGVIAILELRQ